MPKKQHKELWRTIKFGLFSISAGAIELLSFTLFNELLHWPYWASYLTALVLSVLWNFTLNRRFTFKSASNVPLAMLKVFGYYCVFTPVTTIMGNYLAETLGWNEYLVTGLNMLLNLVTEFLFQKYVVFRNTIDTNELAQEE
ncbi:MAG: GtrA family protein [Clostridiales bacterium]|nr:GtrA family protein [Clostridiales bacterium]